MELVLLEDVPGLGGRGEIVSVARGYARNYLLPKNLAQVPNQDVIEAVRRKAIRIQKELEAEKAEKMEAAKDLASVHVTILMKASDEGSLYGSVGPRHVIDALAKQGYELEERQVLLPEHLKQIGDYDVTISLHAEVQVPIKVTVLDEEGAPEQTKS